MHTLKKFILGEEEKESTHKGDHYSARNTSHRGSKDVTQAQKTKT